MKHFEQGDNAPALTRLANQVDALAADVKALTGLRVDVDAHTRTLADLTAVLRDLTGHCAMPAVPASDLDEQGALFQAASGGASDQAPAGRVSGLLDPAPNWLTVTDITLAVRWLDDLSVWVTRIWNRFDSLPGCWPWHAHVVAELLVSRHQWLDATADGVGPDLLAAWHDRWRPGAAHRITRWLAGCERTDGSHVGPRSTRWFYDTAYLEPLALWWATTHGGDPRTPPPGLTKDTTR